MSTSRELLRADRPPVLVASLDDLPVARVSGLIQGRRRIGPERQVLHTESEIAAKPLLSFHQKRKLPRLPDDAIDAVLLDLRGRAGNPEDLRRHTPQVWNLWSDHHAMREPGIAVPESEVLDLEIVVARAIERMERLGFRCLDPVVAVSIDRAIEVREDFPTLGVEDAQARSELGMRRVDGFDLERELLTRFHPEPVKVDVAGPRDGAFENGR